jgi:riboflavin kinase/FMN adenylyltransferase
MKVVLGPEHCVSSADGSAVTIGAYDGVHLGHRYLISELRRMAADRGLRTVAVTFDRHPASVVRPDSAPSLLCDLDQKLELLASTAVDETVVVTFDEARAQETAEDFTFEVLVGALGARLVVVGEDFHFGHGRKGNVALLSELGAVHGFDVVGLRLESAPSGGVVSSTRIRRALAAGDVREATRLLGRHHQVRGVVVHGEGRGSTQLGFPTANIDVPTEIALPDEGIYACFYERAGGSIHPAAVSLGHRPTFRQENRPTLRQENRPTLRQENRQEHEHIESTSETVVPFGAPVLEAFLLDFDGDLYGELARVSFVERLREERRFESVSDLVAAMVEDTDRARAVLATTEPGPPRHLP